MAFYDKESDIFQLMQSVPYEKIAFLTESDSEEKLVEAIRNSTHWIDNSADTNNPPDYLNDVDHIMMDFMRTNDFEKRSKSGKVKNEVAAAENKIIKELKLQLKRHLSDEVTKNVDMNVIPDVAPKPDFEKYYNNIKHVLESHGRQTSKYRENHPNKDIVFCVCDLSEHDHLMQDAAGNTRIFLPCYDRSVLRMIKECMAEYVIWLTPYLMPDRDAPQMVVIDTDKLAPDEYPVCFGVKQGSD